MHPNPSTGYPTQPRLHTPPGCSYPPKIRLSQNHSTIEEWCSNPPGDASCKSSLENPFTAEASMNVALTDGLHLRGELVVSKPSVYASSPDKPFVFSELECWVLRLGDATPFALSGPLPSSVHQLKRSIKREFALQCDLDCIIIHGEAPSVYASSADKPFVFSELECWVLRRGDATPFALSGPSLIRTPVEAVHQARIQPSV